MINKRYLFFDCETTGLIDFKAPISATPRIVQLAALITDSEGVEYGSLNHLIKPDNWTIPDEAAKIHGITTDIALEKGVAICEVMGVFKQLVTLCDVIIAHNIAYDIRIVQGEMHRLSAELPERELVCTMLAMTKVCKIPHAKWKNRIKWPKLVEAYKHCFGKEFDKAHDALADVKACRDIYFHSINPQLGAGYHIKPSPIECISSSITFPIESGGIANINPPLSLVGTEQ